MRSGHAVAGGRELLAVGTLRSRVPTPNLDRALALGQAECQTAQRLARMSRDGRGCDRLLAQRRGIGAAEPGRRGVRRLATRWQSPRACATTTRPDHVAAALTQVALRRKAAAKFGSRRRPAVLHPRRPRAGHPPTRRPASSPPGRRDRCAVGARPRLRHRRGPARLRPYRHAGQRRRTGPADRSDRAGEPRCRRSPRPGRRPATPPPRDSTTSTSCSPIPARRGPAGRVFDPHAFSPPWSFVEQLLGGRGRGQARTRPAARLDPGRRRGRVGQPRRAASRGSALVGPGGRLPAPGDRAATAGRCRRSRPAHRCRRSAAPPTSRPVGRYVYEPDDAVIRAHLVTAFAAAYDGWLLDPHLAYVSADAVRPTALGRAYELIDVLPFKEKALRAALAGPRRRHPDDQEARVDVTPEALRARLRLSRQPARHHHLDPHPEQVPRHCSSIHSELESAATHRTLSCAHAPVHPRAGVRGACRTPLEYVDQRTPRLAGGPEQRQPASDSGSSASAGTECRRSPRSARDADPAVVDR